jgi:ethanolamine utilization protein EutN
MIIAKVVGKIWASRKDERLAGCSLLAVRVKNGDLEVAVDTIGADVGEDVLVVRGRQTKGVLSAESIPVDAAIVAIIDSKEVDKSLLIE